MGEITVKILCDRPKCFEILKKKFGLVKQWTQVSHYWTHLKDTGVIPYKKLLDNSILVRDMYNDSGFYERQLIHKQKTLDKRGDVVSEDKFTCDLTSAASFACIIFERAGLTNWVTMTAEQYIFKNDELEFCVQDVDGLGLYMEIEQCSENDTLDELIEKAKTFGLPLDNDFTGIKLPYMLYLAGR